MFCTYITLYKGNKLPPFYIGYTTVEKIENGYRGSVQSKKYKDIWKKELKDNPHLFKTKILTMHEDRNDAMTREVSFQEQFQVHKNPMYINMNISCTKFFITHHSEETKQKMRRIESPEIRLKRSLARGNRSIPHTEETKRKLSVLAIGRRKGIPHSETHKLNLSKNSGKKKTVIYKSKIYSSLKLAAIQFSQDHSVPFNTAKNNIKKDKNFSYFDVKINNLNSNKE